MSSSNIETKAELQLRIEGLDAAHLGYWFACNQDAWFTDHVNNNRFNDAYKRFLDLKNDRDWRGHAGEYL